MAATPDESSAPSGTVGPAGWHQDPTGRFERRYWDGRRWTAEVLDHGRPSEDPLRPDDLDVEPDDTVDLHLPPLRSVTFRPVPVLQFLGLGVVVIALATWIGLRL